MKKLLLLSVLMLAVSSCYKEHSIDDGKEGDNTKPSTDVMKHLPTDQSRIIRYNGAEANTYSSRAVTRANEDAAHPYVAAPDLATVNAQELTSDKMNDVGNGGVWKISKNSTNKNIWINYVNAPIEIYVEASDVSIGLNSANSNYSTIYVLNEADNFTLSNGFLQSGWKLKVWNDSIKFGNNSFTMCSNTWFYYYGEEELDIPYFSIQNPDGVYWFEAHAPVHFSAKPNVYDWGVDHKTKINIGEYWFGSNVIFEDLCIDNKKIAMTFNDCATIHNFEVKGNETDALHMYINYYLEFPEGILFQNGSHSVFHLNNAVMLIGGEAAKNNSGKNVFINGHYIYGEGNSAVFIQGSVTGEMPYLEHRVFRYFRTAEGEGNTLAVFGKRWKNGNNETITEEPVIYVGWASGGSYDQDYRSEGYNTMFEEGNVIVNPIDLDDNFVIDSKDPYDCRADYTSGTQPPTQDEILPPAEHKYSATGLAFDGNYIYICWHSNLPGGEMQDGEEHDHGTNMDPDNDDDNYGGPSVDDNEDWGGIIDIVQINNYHPDNAELYIASTVLNHEHKYNHVKFYDNKLYLASTSWNVGAALHVVPIISTPDEGVGLGFDSENSYRVNLTGKSANCVEIVDNKSIVTISGRSIGGLNWFPLTDESNQSRLYINGDTENYGGKFIYDDGNGKIYAFHNTDAATITTYDYNGNQVGSDWKLTDDNGRTIPLVPYDGKNTIMVKNGKLYACCGRSGLYVFDTNSHSMVGRSKLSANCVDVDDSGYIYVATGGGLAVFNNQNLQVDTKELNTINYVAYTGKGFKYPNGWEEDKTMPDGTAKQSSNYVRVMGGKVFIAYGMYGLRIYTVSELLNPKK